MLAPSIPIADGEGQEVVEVGGPQRHVDRVDAGRLERGVVHHRRQRMHARSC